MGRRARQQYSTGQSGPVWLVSVGLVLGTVAGWVVSFRAGGLVIAAVLAGIGAARAVLPVTSLGPLAVRSRAVDVLTCLVLAVCLAVLSLAAPGGGGAPGASGSQVS